MIINNLIGIDTTAFKEKITCNYRIMGDLVKVLALSDGISELKLDNIDFNNKKYSVSLLDENGEKKLNIICSDGRNLCLGIALKSYPACDGLSEWNQTYIDIGIECASDIKRNQLLDIHLLVKDYSTEFYSYENVMDIDGGLIKHHFQSSIEYRENNEVTPLDKDLYPTELTYNDDKGTISIREGTNEYEFSTKNLSLVAINGKPVKEKKTNIDSQILKRLKKYIKIKDRSKSLINSSAFDFSELDNIKRILLVEVVKKKTKSNDGQNRTSSEEVKKLVRTLSPEDKENLIINLLTQDK